MLQFLKEFTKLSPAEQKVFLYCLEYCPRPRAYSGDLQEITLHTGLYYQTVRQALSHISAMQTLSRAVKYIHSDVSAPVMVSLDAVLSVGGRQSLVDFDFDAVDRALDQDQKRPLDPDKTTETP
jgi:hypothetical protein